MPSKDRPRESCTLEERAPRTQLFASLYHELHRMARRELRRSGKSLTLGATTLLHEAYLNLHGRKQVEFPDRARFLAYAGRTMRGLVIDHIRSQQADKRGAGVQFTALPAELEQAGTPAELERLSEAIERLSHLEARLAQLVDLKYFGGFSFVDIAAMWGASERTVQRDWEKARLLLYRMMVRSEADGAETHGEKAQAISRHA